MTVTGRDIPRKGVIGMETMALRIRLLYYIISRNIIRCFSRRLFCQGKSSSTVVTHGKREWQ